MKTRQQLFDLMYLHVLKQGRPAIALQPMYTGRVEMAPSCAYRTPEGLKCAFGSLIPDHIYHEEMEGKVCSSLLSDEYRDHPWSAPYIEWLTGEIDPADYVFARHMQGAHDSVAHRYSAMREGSAREFIHRFKQEAARAAEKFGVTIPEVV